MGRKSRRISSESVVELNISDSDDDDPMETFCNFLQIEENAHHVQTGENQLTKYSLVKTLDQNVHPHTQLPDECYSGPNSDQKMQSSAQSVEQPVQEFDIHHSDQNGVLQPDHLSQPCNGSILIHDPKSGVFKSHPGMPRNIVWTTMQPKTSSPSKHHWSTVKKFLPQFVKVLINALIASTVIFGNLIHYYSYPDHTWLTITSNIVAVVWLSYHVYVNRTLLLLRQSRITMEQWYNVSATSKCRFAISRRLHHRYIVLLSCACLLLLAIGLCYVSNHVIAGILFMLVILLLAYLYKTSSTAEPEPKEEPWYNYLTPCRNCSDLVASVEKEITRELSATYLSNQCHILRPYFATTQHYCECAVRGEGSVLRRLARRRCRAAEELDLMVVCTEFSVDAAHVSNDGDLHTWIHIPQQVKKHLRLFLSDVFVECPTNPIWQCLSYPRCRKVLALRLLQHQVIIDSANKLQIKFTTPGRQLLLNIRVAFQYNGWPRGAKQWMQQSAQSFLPRNILHQLISQGCYLVHEPCPDPTCCHALDWCYDFTQAISVLMDYHQPKTALLLAFLLICEEFRSHLHYFTSYFRDLLQSLTYIYLTKAQKSKRAFFGPMHAENVTCLAKEMLRKFSNCLQRRRLQHYFMNKTNIMQNMSKDEIGAFIVCTNKVFDGIHQTVAKVLHENKKAYLDI